MTHPQSTRAPRTPPTHCRARGRLRELFPEQCARLLTERATGRVAFVDWDGPAMLPVTYAVDGKSLIFSISPYSHFGRRLATEPAGLRAAFEVDDIDEHAGTGWSVLVRGRAKQLDPHELPPASQPPQSWPEGHHSLFVRLSTEKLTGRWLLAG